MLDVRSGASDDELRKAFRTKAKQWHPDLQASDASKDREAATSRMGELNAAFALLNERGTRVSGGETGARVGREQAQGDTQRGHPPARPLIFRQVTGLILVRRWANLTQTLYRSCGLAAGADIQSRTMMTGWWGVLSAVHNVFAAAANAINLLKAERWTARCR